MYKDHIKPLYKWWEEATKDDGTGHSKKLTELNPIELPSTGDMLEAWKMLGKGGTSKIKTFFCHCCDCVSDKIHHHSSTNCDFCDEFVNNHPSWKDTWKFYHK